MAKWFIQAKLKVGDNGPCVWGPCLITYPLGPLPKCLLVPLVTMASHLLLFIAFLCLRSLVEVLMSLLGRHALCKTDCL